VTDDAEATEETLGSIRFDEIVWVSFVVSALEPGRLTKTFFVPAPKVTILPPLLDEIIVVRASVDGAVNVPMPTSQLDPACSAIV
jgi:hypothetical protein